MALSQKEANIWYFGYNAGLDFNSGYPAALQNSAMKTHGGSAVMSNRVTGELLFYSNGEKVWNKNHQIMYNGDELLGTSEADQCALIIPVPGSNTQYYLFTIKAVYDEGIASNMHYSIINMESDNGLGGVTTKNELLVSNVNENLTAVKHKNSNSYWLVTHRANSNVFLSFGISKNGISAPVENAIGSVWNGADRDNGELKFSPDGTMIAGGQGAHEPTPVELFDFDAATGTISNYRHIATLSSQYGISFSPDNSKLYVSGTDLNYRETSGDGGDYIYQFDLSNPATQAIKDSKLPLFSLNNTVTNIGRYAATIANGMQIGPDGKIYAAGNITIADETGSIVKRNRNGLFVIEHPNQRGYNCYITLKFFDFGEGEVAPGLPNFIQSTFNLRVSEEEELPCNNDIAYSVFPNPVSDFFKISVQQDCFEPYNFALYNSIGQLIREGFVFTRESNIIDVQSLSDGMYILHFSVVNRRIVKKIIKQSE